MNELVIIKNKNVVVSSREIATSFKKRHDKLASEIERMYGEYTQKMSKPEMVDTPLFYESIYIHEQNGQKYKEYLMNRDGFSLLVMGFTGKDALAWKLKYINAFNMMELQLKSQMVERIKSIGVRHILTDTIKKAIPDSPHKRFAYPNYTKLIYKMLFDKTPKELKELYNTDSIRDCLATDDLKDVQSAEMLVSSLINCGWGYEQIKGFLEINLIKELQ